MWATCGLSNHELIAYRNVMRKCSLQRTDQVLVCFVLYFCLSCLMACVVSFVSGKQLGRLWGEVGGEVCQSVLICFVFSFEIRCLCVFVGQVRTKGGSGNLGFHKKGTDWGCGYLRGGRGLSSTSNVTSMSLSLLIRCCPMAEAGVMIPYRFGSSSSCVARQTAASESIMAVAP